MNHNNESNHQTSQGQAGTVPSQQGPHQANEPLRGPDNVVIDLSQAMDDFRKNVEYVRFDLDAQEVLVHLTREIIEKDSERDAVLEFVSTVRHRNEERMRPNEMACIADAIERFGMALVARLRSHNIFNPETGRFEYGFYGFGRGQESMAVFRRLPRYGEDEG